MVDYGNNYGTIYSIDLEHPKNWAKVNVDSWNDGYASRGHSTTDWWTEAEGYIDKKEAEEFAKKVLKEFRSVENEIFGVYEIYKEIKKFIIDHLEDYEEWGNE